MLWPILLILPFYIAGMVALPLASRHRPRRYPLLKGVESLLFVLCGFFSYTASGVGGARGFALLFAALLCCMAGDIFLSFTTAAKRMNHGPFLAGAFSFCVAHGLFLTLFVYTSPLRWYDFIFPLAAVGVIALLDANGLVRLKKMRVLGYLYSFIVALMTGKAVAAGMALGLATPHGALTALGAVLFFVSDCVLLFLYFGKNRRFWMRVLNLSTYYSGVMMLALTGFWAGM